MVTCPICGVSLPHFRGHGKHHGIDTAILHAMRLEVEHGRPIASLLRKIYTEDRLSPPQIFRQYGITFRMLRRLLNAHDIPMRDMKEAIVATWEKDDGTRSEATSRKMKETRSLFDFTGDNHPSKRPEVRQKISAAKRKHNPGLDLMQAHIRRVHEESTVVNICKHCLKPFPVKQSHAFQMFCAMECFYLFRGPSTIETIMGEALVQAGIDFVAEYRLGRYVIDFALVDHQIAVEADGEYWHATDRDALRDAVLASKGWLTIRYTQAQIKGDINTCIQDLIAQLNELGIDPTASQ